MTPTIEMRRAAVVQAVSEHAGAFSWGERDCVTFAARVVELIRGAPVVVPTWRTHNDACDEIDARGGLAAAITSLLGAPFDPRARSPVCGDVVLVHAPGFAMCAVWANGSPIGITSHGIGRLSAARVAFAWSS